MFLSEKSVTFFCILPVIAVFAGSSLAFSRVPSEPAAVQGKVLVSFHEDVGKERIEAIVESVGGTVENVFASTGVHVIVLEEGADVAEAVEKLSSYREVRYAEPVERARMLEEK